MLRTGVPGNARELRESAERQIHLEGCSFEAEACACRRRISGSRRFSSDQVEECAPRVEIGRDYVRRISSPSSSTTPAASAVLDDDYVIDGRIRANLGPACSAADGDRFDTAPMPPRTKPHNPRWPPTPPMDVVQQDVSRTGRPRSAVGADDAVGREGDFDFGDSNHSSRKSAALCVKIFTSPDDLTSAEFASPRGNLQIFDKITRACGWEIRRCGEQQ